MPKKNKKREEYTGGGILSWIFGIVFAITGLGMMGGSFAYGLLFFLYGLIITPKGSVWLYEKTDVKLGVLGKIGLYFAVVFLGGFLGGFSKGLFGTVAVEKETAPEPSKPVEAEEVVESETVVEPPVVKKVVEPEPKRIVVVSKDFGDVSRMFCGQKTTSLQKEHYFNQELKGKYVQWTGVVSQVSETWGSYSVQARLCKSTFASDIIVTMDESEVDKLLGLSPDQFITFRAKLTRWGDFIGFSADEGIIIES